MPLPQPKEQRAERIKTGEGLGTGAPNLSLRQAQGMSALLWRMFGAWGQALTKGAVSTAHGGRPARAAATSEPREADVGAQPASAREERAPSTFCTKGRIHLLGSESLPASQYVSQQTVLETSSTPHSSGGQWEVSIEK